VRVFITGIGGFAGSHLADHLLALGHEVSGLILPEAGRENVAHLAGRVALHAGNLLDSARLKELLLRERPEWVFHLAAQSSVAASWENPAETFEVNAVGGARLLEGCLPLKGRVRVVIVTSAEIHGEGTAGAPITEDSPFAPPNPYAVSKLALDLLAGQFARARGLDVVRMRPMNHAGPRQAAGFVLADFARQVAEIEAGLREPLLRVGNTDARRDFADVRDVVRAYALAAERGAPGEAYLVSSGKARRVGEALEILRSLARKPFSVERDRARLRPADPSYRPASAAKLAAQTGWRAEIPLEQTLRDTLEHWRARVSSTAVPP